VSLPSWVEGGVAGMAKRYRVTLTMEERGELGRMIARGKADARKLAHARILLQADEAKGGPARVDEDVASALDVSVRTVERVRQRFVEQGLAAALLPKPSPRRHERKLDGEQEARLIALACSTSPDAGWARPVDAAPAAGAHDRAGACRHSLARDGAPDAQKISSGRT
jgi:Winged helix-turn helix